MVLFLAVFPQLHVAGRQAFFAESTGVEKERLTPRIRQTAQAVLLLYLALTGAAALGYALAGVPLFEAVANALATVPAGGFSPNPQSFAGYPPLAQWLGVAFMFLAGVNFLLQYRLFFRGEVGPLLRDAEFRAYVLVVLAAGLALSGYLYTHHTYDLEASLRHAFFQVISILTGTGFASVDFAQWVVPAQAILVLLMFVGEARARRRGDQVGALARPLRLPPPGDHPHPPPPGGPPLAPGGRVLSEEVLRQVSVFILLYTLLFVLGAVALAFLEKDFVVAFTASAQAIGNIGPGLGEVGPMGSYAGLHPLSKLLLVGLMWAGRIEVVPVVLLLTPELWRRLR